MGVSADRRRFLKMGAWGAGAAALVAAARVTRRPTHGIPVGFSQMDNAGSWRVAETNSLREEAARRGGYQLFVTDAQDQTAKQVADVEDLIARRVRAIFIAPREFEGLDPVFEAAGRAEIPIFLIDRVADARPGVDYVAFLGSDFVEQGRRSAAWLAKATGGEASVVELTGTAGSSVANDRAGGFAEELARHPGMRMLTSQTAQFSRAVGQRVMENLIQAHGRAITAVYAHNDEMAIGAIQALRAASLRPGVDVTLVSIDGERAALEAIIRGELGASVESNPRFGPLAFETLERHLRGEPVPPRIILDDRLFDASNAAEFVDEAF
ncbi:MAG TPA: ABC transporter substrate-binding protein [Kofleriaceae bacterium]|nr:ABC transporter substrate-binding protein [Kofleriaceae bacterium]